MKKIFAIVTLLFSLQLQAQVSEGIIKYTMQLEGMGGAIASGMGATIYFKKDKSLTEMNTPMYSMKTLNDENGLLVLMNINGRKTFTKKSRAELDREQKSSKTFEPVIEVTKEKKNILGYECSRAFITMPAGKGPQNKMSVWHTTKILNSTANLGGFTPDMAKKLKGTVLEIDIQQGGTSSSIKAVSISVKPVPDGVFKLSTAGYVEKKAGSAR